MFGNKLAEKNVYNSADGIAYLSVTGYRGLKSNQVQFSDPEVAEFKRWFIKWKRASDDGPDYG